MMKNRVRHTAYKTLLFIICATGYMLAQTPTRMGPASEGEIKKALIALEADMNNQKAHRAYIFAMGMKNPRLWDQYEAWMKEHPDNVNIPLSIGTVYYKASMPQPKDFLLKAAAMDPKNANIWYMLAADAHTGAQKDLFAEYIGKATSADTLNAGYAYGYLKSFENTDPGIYEKKVLIL